MLSWRPRSLSTKISSSISASHPTDKSCVRGVCSTVPYLGGAVPRHFTYPSCTPVPRASRSRQPPHAKLGAQRLLANRAGWEFTSMNRSVPGIVALLVFSFIASAAWAQSEPSKVEKTRSRKDAKSAQPPAAPQLLFGALLVSTHSAEARQFVEKSLDEYENVTLEES